MRLPLSLVLIFSFSSYSYSYAYRDTLNLRANLFCSIREDWCFNITIFTVDFAHSQISNLYPRDQDLLKKSICSKSPSSIPLFQNITIPSNYKFGARVSYQLSHTCTGDGRPECVQLTSSDFVLFRSDPMFEEEFQFAPHELGITNGRGECEN